MKFIFTIFLFLIFHSRTISAADSLKIYELGEINIISSNVNKILPFTSQVKHFQIQSKDAVSFENLRILLPSFNLQTNSRGETIFSYRGSRERQINFYLDGALLSVPWDGRADLNMISPSIIGRLEFVPSTTIYGANNLMGIVSISTYERTNDGFGGSVRTQIGDGGMKNIELANEGKINNFSYTAVANWLETDGKIAAKDNVYELDSYNSALIPNSFTNQKNFYGKTVFRPNDFLAIGASANYIKYSKGVIPEQHRLDRARFWKYNDNERLLLTLNSNIFTDSKHKNTVRFTYWFDNFTQNIDQFTNIHYDTKNATEDSKDYTHGFRIIDVYNFSTQNSITFAANALMTQHNEQIDTYENGTVTETAINEYSQNTFSLSAEYNHILWELFSFKFGTQFDHWITPKTGVWTEAEGRNNNAFGVIGGVNYLLRDNNILFFNFSRKTRFPSLRESYSAALGKFKVNPDLSPEKNLFFEVGSSINQFKNLFLKTTLFANFYEDMIVRTFDLETGLEMRDNIASAKIYGLELVVGGDLSRCFKFDANFSYMYSEGKNDNEFIKHLDYQPDFLSGLTLYFVPNPIGFKAQLEVDFVGKQYALLSSDIYEKLVSTCFLNFRLSYDFLISDDIFVEIYVRLNNIFDEYRQVRLGIPAAGRTVLGGFMFRI